MKKILSQKNTEIIETDLDLFDQINSDVPFCILSKDYFSFALERDKNKSPHSLSIETWDGKKVISIDVG